MKNNYAAKLQEKKRLEAMQIRLETIRHTTSFLQDVFTLALNSEGFGRERINRINGHVNEIVEKYTAMQDDDIDYAEGKLREAVRKVMGEEE